MPNRQYMKDGRVESIHPDINRQLDVIAAEDMLEAAREAEAEAAREAEAASEAAREAEAEAAREAEAASEAAREAREAVESHELTRLQRRAARLEGRAQEAESVHRAASQTVSDRARSVPSHDGERRRIERLARQAGWHENWEPPAGFI